MQGSTLVNVRLGILTVAALLVTLSVAVCPALVGITMGGRPEILIPTGVSPVQAFGAMPTLTALGLIALVWVAAAVYRTRATGIVSMIVGLAILCMALFSQLLCVLGLRLPVFLIGVLLVAFAGALGAAVGYTVRGGVHKEA